MQNTNKSRFKIVLTGSLKPGVSLEEATQCLSLMLKAPPEKVIHLLQGRPITIKTQLNADSVDQYRKALDKTGVEFNIVEDLLELSLATCPKCGYQAKSPDDDLLCKYDGLGECPRCGIIPKKYIDHGIQQQHKLENSGQENFVDSPPVDDEKGRQKKASRYRKMAVLGSALCVIALVIIGYQYGQRLQAISTTEIVNQADNLYAHNQYKEAFPLFYQLAKQGVAPAQAILGNMYALGQGVIQDYDQAIIWYRKAAEQGNAKGQNGLGISYAEGHGVAQDYKQAIAWYQRAAEQGYARAQFNLGFMYFNGKGVTTDYKQSFYWWRKAAEMEDADAQVNLGALYADGRGVTQDYVQATEWYRKAAAQGNSAAYFNLGQIYAKGQGVTQDYTQAADWYRKAAEQGLAVAESALGKMYFQGQGVTQDYAQAAEWYRKAAEQGDADAEVNLGVMYAQGQGVTKDYSQAIDWFRKATEHGSKKATELLEILQANVEQDAGFSFRGIKLGSKLSEYSKCPIKDTGSSYNGKKIYEYDDTYKNPPSPCYYPEPHESDPNTFTIRNLSDIPGAQEWAEVTIVDGGIEQIENHFWNNDSAPIYESMMRKYGTPSWTDDPKYQNDMGATFIGNNTTWIYKGNYIRFIRFGFNRELGKIIVTSPKYQNLIIKRNNEYKNNILDKL